MLKVFETYYRQQMFFPGIGGVLINPFYFARKDLAKHIGDLAEGILGKTLDVGCGKKPYEKLFRSTQYVGLEYDSAENRLSKKADFFYDGNSFPFPENSFDSVVCNQVLEHVFMPDQFLLEVNRILQDGGALLITVPFLWDEHEQPFDFARYTSFGLKSLLERNGFNVIEQRKTLTDVRVIFQLLNAYMYKIIMFRNGLLNHFMARIMTAPFNIFGELLFRIMPKNADLYLDNVVFARKIKSFGYLSKVADEQF